MHGVLNDALVIVSGRNAERGEEVVPSILDRGGEARFVAANLRRSGRVDEPATHAALRALHRARRARARGPGVFLLTGLLAPAMVDRGSGAIVNVGSINATLSVDGGLSAI